MLKLKKLKVAKYIQNIRKNVENVNKLWKITKNNILSIQPQITNIT
jgi:hypothetical protein